MIKALPYADLLSQENRLKKLVVDYYVDNELFEEEEQH
jgi:hypothetical protein